MPFSRTLSDRAQFLRTAWGNPAFTDVTLAIRFRQEYGDKEDHVAARYVDCVKFQMAKHSPIFRAQIERWDCTAAAASAGRMVEATVEGEEDLAAMMQLLEAMHVEKLPAVQQPESGMHLCRLLRLAHFYSVRLVLEGAAEELQRGVARLSATECAAALCALQPLAEGEESGGTLPRALAACEKQLLHLLDPLDRIFGEEELGGTFDALPLAAVARAVQGKPVGAAPSQETAFLATLRWLDANEGGGDGATDQLLSLLDYERLSSTTVLAAARGHARFRAWPGALPALAAAALLRGANARVGSGGPAATACRQRLKALGESPALASTWPPPPPPPPLKLDLEVPLIWLTEQAAALEQRTARLQAQPSSEQEIDCVQQKLVAVFRGAQRAYRGHSWVPSLALFLRINRPTATTSPPPVFGQPAHAPPAPPAPAGTARFVFWTGAHAQQQVSLTNLHLSASLQLEVMPLPPLAPAPAGTTGGTSAYTPGPLASVTFATGGASGGLSTETPQGNGMLVLGAYGVRDVAAAAATTSGFGTFSFGPSNWQPPCPPGGAARLVSAFESRPLFAHQALPAAHKLPDLSMHLRGGKLRFQVTVALDD